MANGKKRFCVKMRTVKNNECGIMCDEVKVQDLDPVAQDLIKDANELSCARFGDTGYTLPLAYKRDANNFRNMAVRPDDMWITSFPRSGGSGGWRAHFDAEMEAQAQRWLRENLDDTDLRFPRDAS